MEVALRNEYQTTSFASGRIEPRKEAVRYRGFEVLGSRVLRLDIGSRELRM